MALPKSEHDLDKKGSVWSLRNQTLPLYVTFLSRISAAIYGNPRTFSTGCINSTHRTHPVSPAQPTPDAPGIPTVPDISAMPDAHCICSFAVLRPHCTQHLYSHCTHTAPDTYTPDTRYLCSDRVMRMPRLRRADCSLSASVSGVSVPMLRSFCVNARLSRIRAPRPVPRLRPSMLTLAPSVPPGPSASVPRPFGAYTSAAPRSFSCQGMAQSASATGSRIHTSGVTRRVKPQPLSAAHSFIGSRGKP